MSRIAFNIAGAAEEIDTTAKEISNAISARTLRAHRVGDRAIILSTDLAAWVEAQPEWYATS